MGDLREESGRHVGLGGGHAEVLVAAEDDERGAVAPGLLGPGQPGAERLLGLLPLLRTAGERGQVPQVADAVLPGAGLYGPEGGGALQCGGELAVGVLQADHQVGPVGEDRLHLGTQEAAGHEGDLRRLLLAQEPGAREHRGVGGGGGHAQLDEDVVAEGNQADDLLRGLLQGDRDALGVGDPGGRPDGPHLGAGTRPGPGGRFGTP